jgi:hypothetical protein
VIAGSQDPLLDWAVKESGCGLALLPGGSLDGLRRLAEGEAVAAGLHLLDPDSGDYNEPALRRGLGGHGLVLIEWARRQQGLVVAAGNPHGIAELADLRRGELRLVRRQAEAGSQLLFAHLLELAGIAESELAATSETARGEIDLGLAILEDRCSVSSPLPAARPSRPGRRPWAVTTSPGSARSASTAPEPLTGRRRWGRKAAGRRGGSRRSRPGPPRRPARR